MTEDRYTLEEARVELAHRECRARGHDLTLIDARTHDRGHAPVGVHCERCRRHWDIGSGHGGVNLGEADGRQGAALDATDSDVVRRIRQMIRTNDPELGRFFRQLARIGDPSIVSALRRAERKHR